MRRTGHLIERIADADNLRLAFVKASRGKRRKQEVLRFREHLDSSLLELSRQLRKGDVEWGEYHCFKLYDPKERLIHAPCFRTRLAHHAIMNLCELAFESYQIFDSYACRKNKGLDGAISRARRFSRAGGWFLKMDIRKYFDSIDHKVLLMLLNRRFKDKTVLRLFESIIGTYETGRQKGVPIGNLTSQFFANHYLAPLDHHIKQTLRIRRYVRYMDDFVLWSESRERLREVRRTINNFLFEQLKLQSKPPCLNACARGLPFLGFKVYPTGLPRLSRRSRQRFRRKLRAYYRLFRDGIWDDKELAIHLEPLTAFVQRGASRKFRRETISAIEIQFGVCPEARTG